MRLVENATFPGKLKIRKRARERERRDKENYQARLEEEITPANIPEYILWRDAHKGYGPSRSRTSASSV